MHSNSKLLKLLTGAVLLPAVGVCSGEIQTLANPPGVTGGPRLVSPPESFLDDPLLGSSLLFPFRDGYDYAPSGYTQAHAVLSVPKTNLRQVRLGSDPSEELFTLDIRFCNDTGNSRSFYNLDWNPFIPYSGRLALYDSQKQYVCDLLDRRGGSQTIITTNNWTDVSASSYVGKILYVSLPYPSYKVLSPGRYYLQVIYLQRVVRSPSDTNMRADKPDPIGQAELFRSNVVPITVVDQSAVKTPNPAVTH